MDSIYISLGQAAKLAEVHKGTISKAISDGNLSFVEKTKAGYKIDPAELERWNNSRPRKRLETAENRRLETLENNTATPEIKALERENKLLREQLERERLQCDQWRTAYMAQLPAPKKKDDKGALDRLKIWWYGKLENREERT